MDVSLYLTSYHLRHFSTSRPFNCMTSSGDKKMCFPYVQCHIFSPVFSFFMRFSLLNCWQSGLWQDWMISLDVFFNARDNTLNSGCGFRSWILSAQKWTVNSEQCKNKYVEGNEIFSKKRTSIWSGKPDKYGFGWWKPFSFSWLWLERKERKRYTNVCRLTH